MGPKDAEGIVNSVDPDQTAPLIWVYTVCPGISVRKLRIIMVSRIFLYTPQPLYKTIVGVQINFCVCYPNRVIMRVKCIGYIGKEVLNCYLGSNPDPCYIQNHVITNSVIKRFKCLP